MPLSSAGGTPSHVASNRLRATEPSPHVALVSRVVSNDVPSASPRFPAAAVLMQKAQPRGGRPTR